MRGWVQRVGAGRKRGVFHTQQCRWPWVAFELGYPSAPDDLIASYADDPIAQTDTVYGYVPAEVVEALIQKHGGIA